MYALLDETGTDALKGMEFPPRSLCIGIISSSYAAGVPLEVKMGVSNHSIEPIARKRFLNPLLDRSADAALFFGRVIVHENKAGH